jgi:hypothetical protein
MAISFCVSDGSVDRVHRLKMKINLNSFHLLFTVSHANLC